MPARKAKDTTTRTRGSKSPHVDKVYNLVPSVKTESDWTFAVGLKAGVLRRRGELPAAVDLRKSWWKISNQGQTGSCVGWATADGVLRYHLVTANRLPQNNKLSVRFVWMASKETDEFTFRPTSFIEASGTSLKSAMDIIRKYGCPLDKELPFNIDTLMYTSDENLLYVSASTRKAANYFNLGKDPNQWKQWLATTGPILAGVVVDSTWVNASKTRGRLDAFNPNGVMGGHAITIVGYTADRFIIRNSWGTEWGDKGFAYASYAYIRDAFFEESYGITI
ncbi:MAG: C1 family peptidase [Acidobacteriota bacterium]